MNSEEMKIRKQELGWTNEILSERSGVPLSTVQKILGGTTHNPRKATMDALEQALYPGYPDRVSEAVLAYGESDDHRSGAKIPALPVRKQGEYTLDDYYAIPDDRRVELIDGVIWDMPAPRLTHQLIAGSVYAQMYNYMLTHPGNCMPAISPVDVQLDCDNRTMVQPDVIVLCDQKKNLNRCIYGAPDFVLEVLSPSSRRKDMIIKLNKYMIAGCKEYWIVDPKDEKIYVYNFDGNPLLTTYTFDDPVPVRISGGDLVIDFRQVRDQIHTFFPDEDETDDEADALETDRPMQHPTQPADGLSINL